jgi:flagellar biosynthetic protein FliR
MAADLAIDGVSGPALPGMDLQIIMAYLANFFVSSLRIGSFILSAPFFGARWVPLNIRIIMSMSLATSIAMTMPLLPPELLGSPVLITIIMTEISIGLCAGLIMTIFFGAVSLAGEKIASTSGLSYAAQIDPNAGGQTPVVSQILYLFLMVIFVSLDGHLIVIRSILETYYIMPVGFQPNADVMIASGIEAAGAMFFGAAMIMLPITMILLFINTSIGIVTRSAPQLNLFSFGFPISLMGVFFILYFSADFLGYAMSDLTNEAIQHLHDLIGALHHG